jgi:hypothetical protein
MSEWIQEKIVKTKLLAAVATFLSFTLSIQSTFAADAYMPEISVPVQQNEVIFMATEPGISQNFNWLSVQPGRAALGENRGNWITCTGTKDPNCDLNNPGPDGIVGNLILPHCSTAAQKHCIESLSFAKDDKDFQEADFIREAEGAKTFEVDENVNFPGAGNNSLWKSTNAEHAGGFNYVVSVRLGVGLFPGSKKFIANYLNAVVTPYREVTGNYNPNFLSGPANVCLFIEAGKCGYPQDFPNDIRVKLKFRVSNELGGWFQGRLKNPNISVDPIDNSTNKITLDAEPVKVPRTYFIKNKSQLNNQELNWFANQGSWGTGNGVASGVDAGHPEIFDFINYVRPLSKDTASGINTFWSLTTTKWGSGSSCLSDTKKVLGIVTTNAMGYDGNAPSFIKGSLDYKVSGLHYLPDGVTESIGTYNLVMRSDTARCLYGFTAAPIQATVTIVSGNTATLVGTTTVSEKDGWLKLAAYGFTFSEKILKVKITQAKNTKFSITCSKGKLIKKITAIKPKCPSGYRIKA